ncbi:MAG: alcohol dehydrogenase catalytic domain-containing protein [Myxococcales bacterium]|nr:alcohol dehydrogenase catalytic domain-containing protein [Myxococcales bacterium]MCB9643365.1 alcohol dehydrogenase catalytic domain-containing protein [Myxococcales bacterium]
MQESSYSAMTLVAPRTFEQQSRILEPLQPHEVWLRVRMAGVCGTDLAIYKGNYKVPLPRVLGHEYCAEVERVGENVPASWLGRRVVSEINNACPNIKTNENCSTCGRLHPNHCPKRTVTGIIKADGAFAEYVRVPFATLHTLPDEMSDEIAVFVEPMAAALQTFSLRPLSQGERVVVIGAGRLGLLIIAAARAAGAHVVAITRSEVRQQFAMRFGAEAAFAPNEHTEQEIRNVFHGQLADVVVEVTGTPQGLSSATQWVRPRGTICLKTTAGIPSEVDLTKIVVDEIQLSGSRCGPFASAIHFLEQTRIPLEKWITERFHLSKLATAMKAAQQPGKVLVQPIFD